MSNINYTCKVETKSPIKRELTISVKPDSIEKYIESELQQMKKRAKVKGFRPGKVPEPIVRKLYLDDIKSEVYSKVIRESYLMALEEQKLKVVGSPQIEPKSGPMKDGEAIEFIAKVEIVPEIKVADLKKIKVERPSSTVTDEDLSSSLENLRKYHAEVVPMPEHKGAAKKGDMVVVSFQGKIDGVENEGLKGTNQLVRLGAEYFPKEFEEALIGMKKDENKVFSYKIADEINDKKAAGKTAEISITVHEFKEEKLPALDDEFAKRFKVESIKELKEKMKKDLQETRDNRARADLKENLLNALVEAHDFEVPAYFIDLQVQHLMRENATRLKREGYTEKMIRDFVEKNFKEIQAQALKQVKSTLILDTIAEQEQVKVEAADLEREYAKLAERNNVDIETVRKSLTDSESQSNLRFFIKEERTVDLLLEKVNVVAAKK